MADRDLIASLRRDVNRLTQTVKLLARQATAIADRSQRYATLIDPLAVGYTTLPITWPLPFPDGVYLVLPSVVVASAQLGQVSIQAGAKTAEGCTLVIRNVGLATTCIVDVMAIRT